MTPFFVAAPRPGQLSLGSGAVITTRGLDFAIRGVLVGTKRPDLVIIDDPESARLGPQRRPDGPPRSAQSKPDWAAPASGWPA